MTNWYQSCLWSSLAFEQLGAKTCAADLVHGQPLWLPQELMVESDANKNADKNIFLCFRSSAVLRKGEANHLTSARWENIFVFKDLATAKAVFVRHDAVKNSLRMPYDGPYPVISRTDKIFKIRIKSREVNISIDRLKPACSIAEDSTFNKRPVNVKTLLEKPTKPPTTLPATTSTPTALIKRTFTLATNQRPKEKKKKCNG